MEPKAGDLSFIPCDGSAVSRLISRMEQEFNETGGAQGLQMVHVGIIGRNADTIIQMTHPRCEEIPLAQETRTKVIMRPKCSDDVKEKAVSIALAKLGMDYNVGEYLMSHLGLIQNPERFCSAFAFDCYKQSGFTFSLPKNGKGDTMVSPDELFMSPDLEKVA